MATAVRWFGTVAVVLVLVAVLLSTPALAHEGHAGHEDGNEGWLSIWSFLAVIGIVTAAGSLLASPVLDVPRQHAAGLAAGGGAVAVIAAIVGVL